MTMDDNIDQSEFNSKQFKQFEGICRCKDVCDCGKKEKLVDSSSTKRDSLKEFMLKRAISKPLQSSVSLSQANKVKTSLINLESFSTIARSKEDGSNTDSIASTSLEPRKNEVTNLKVNLDHTLFNFNTSTHIPQQTLKNHYDKMRHKPFQQFHHGISANAGKISKIWKYKDNLRYKITAKRKSFLLNKKTIANTFSNKSELFDKKNCCNQEEEIDSTNIFDPEIVENDDKYGNGESEWELKSFTSEKSDELEEEREPHMPDEEFLNNHKKDVDTSALYEPMTQIPMNEETNVDNEDELMELCSGIFHETNEPSEDSNSSFGNTNTLMSEDGALHSLTKEVQKRRKLRLGFSDDENDSDDEDISYGDETLSNVEDKQVPVSKIEQPEIESNQQKCKVIGSEFFENEAELSDSEWGSADEDEDGMNEYDVELADEIEFDSEHLKSELGQIYMRQTLNEDMRELKKMKEIFMKTEEGDGNDRKRQFKWKYCNNDFSIEKMPEIPQNVSDNGNCDEEEWRKMRYERYEILKRNQDAEFTKLQIQNLGTINNNKKIVIADKCCTEKEK